MRKILLAIIFSLNVILYVRANKYYGYKLIEVTHKTADDLQLLRQLHQQNDVYDFLSFSVLPQIPSRLIVNSIQASNLTRLFLERNIRYEIINQNVGKTVSEQFMSNKNKVNPRLKNHFYRLSPVRYYSHSEINKYLNDLATQFPTRAFVRTIGFSYERRPLKTLTITNGDGKSNKNVILVDGGIHAREWISPAAVIYIIEQLVENFEENRALLLDYDWVILPVVNADGYEYSRQSENTRFWRKTRKPSSENCYGTDPNRNFGFHWNDPKSYSTPCDITYPGSKAFSEPEAVVLRDLMHSLTGRGKMYLTLHSYGPFILYPWGYIDKYTENWEELDEIARAGRDAIESFSGRVYTVGMSTATLYAAPGASDDYAYSVGFPITFTMELPPGGTGFDPPVEAIDDLVTETWTGVRAMALKVVEKYPLPK